MHEATQFVHAHGAELRDEYRVTEQLGRLSDRTVELLKGSGGLRLLLAKDLGGYEAHPQDFFEWVMAVGSYHPSAGWVAGVCGVHPFEFSMMSPQVRDEVYGTDPNTLVSSPYAPFGRARAVEGGYLLSGRWPYSTGTDHAAWVILGGLVTDETGAVPHHGGKDNLHFVLPRDAEYEIVEDSWKVMGLEGTGSKDIVMKDVFVPEYRTVRELDMEKGLYANKYRPDSALYRMGFLTLFPGAIAAGTFGIVIGLLREIREYLENRVNAVGQAAKTDPFTLVAYARAEGDLEASLRHYLGAISDVFDWVSAGNSITKQQRIDLRRNQVLGTDRSIRAVTDLYTLAGSQSIQKKHLMEGFFRDLQVAQSHFGNIVNPVLVGWGLHAFGEEIPSTLFY